VRVRLNGGKTEENDRLPVVATRKNSNSNNHLEEAMALLIRNQAAFVEQIARTDRDRTEQKQELEAFRRETRERLSRIELALVELPKQLKKELLQEIQKQLLQLPKAIKKEIGFKARP